MGSGVCCRRERVEKSKIITARYDIYRKTLNITKSMKRHTISFIKVVDTVYLE